MVAASCIVVAHKVCFSEIKKSDLTLVDRLKYKSKAVRAQVLNIS